MGRRIGVPVVTLGLLIVLAAGLSHVSFVGTRYEFPSEELPPSGLPQQSEAPSLSIESPPWWADLILIAASTLLLVSVIFLVFNPRDLKEVARRAVALSLWVVAIYFIIRRLREMGPIEIPTEPSSESLLPSEGPAEALPSYEQFQPPAWTTFFIVLGLVGLVGLSVYLVWRIWKRTSRAGHSLLGEELALVSQRAAADLRAGTALKETILRCYREMAQLLSERAQIAIGRAMTAREFEQALAAAGIQEAHITQLSRLFEWARYSDEKPTPTQEQEAISALETIADRYGQRAPADAP